MAESSKLLESYRTIARHASQQSWYLRSRRARKLSKNCRTMLPAFNSGENRCSPHRAMRQTWGSQAPDPLGGQIGRAGASKGVRLPRDAPLSWPPPPSCFGASENAATAADCWQHKRRNGCARCPEGRSCPSAPLGQPTGRARGLACASARARCALDPPAPPTPWAALLARVGRIWANNERIRSRSGQSPARLSRIRVQSGRACGRRNLFCSLAMPPLLPPNFNALPGRNGGRDNMFEDDWH